MNEGIIAAIASMAAALIGQLRMTSKPDRVRRRIEATLKVLESVKAEPALVASQLQLQGLVNEQSEYLAKIERKAMERRYDPSQPFISALFGFPMAYAAWWAWGQGEWYWRVAAVLIGLLTGVIFWAGISGFFTPPRTKKKAEEA